MMMLVSVLPCSLVASGAAFAMPVVPPIHMTSAPNRLTRHVEMYAMPEDNQKYGHDPRDGKSEVVADPAWKTSPGVVSQLRTIGELQAALNSAEDKQVVALKFKRSNCAACASTVEDYAALAAEYEDAGQFYEVSYEDSKELIKLCQMRAVPTGHIYTRGKLRTAMALNAKKWAEFRAELDASRASLSSE